MRCKPGVLAYIVQDPFPENIGRVVRIVSPAEPIYGCAAWLVQTEGLPLRVLNLSTRAVTLCCDGDCRDVDLRPITGVLVADAQLEPNYIALRAARTRQQVLEVAE